ncbi:MAG: menaquinone biosynthesis protein [Actinomycetota bacterium]
MTARLRVGRISALNMYPLYHHLERAAGPGMVFTDGLPAALNAAVLDGRLDVSAMSSIEFARNSDRLRLLPVASIAAAGAVDSIQLFSRVPFREVRSVAVTPHSATSVTLLRVLLGPHVPFRPLTAAPEDALRDVDGVLLIADEALAALRRGISPHATDLAGEWRDRTGLPMVFGVWAARRDAPPATRGALDALTGLLAEAKARFAADPEEVVAAAAARFPFPAGEIRRYFRRLRYGFGDEERAGLARFLEHARRAGELALVPALPAERAA